ncbi:MAG: type II secretion system protein [bacterium]|nr:type II secretion system protein [bacterium]
MTMTMARNNEGFTLVELIVAMGVFVTAITIASGVFIQGMRSERGLTEAIAVNNEMSLALERMAREIRVGYEFSPSGGELSFKTRDGDVVYALSGSGVILRGGKEITGQNVQVENLKFIVFQQSNNLCSPWRVTVSMSVRARGSTQKFLPIQTTVSSRTLPADLEVMGEEGKNVYRECRGIL